MLILNPEAPVEQQEEILSRTRELILEGGGSVAHMNEWGRRKIAFPIEKKADGNYVVITCETTAPVLNELGRIFTISRDVVLRAVPIRLSVAQAARAKANGAPMPIDDRPDEPRAPRGGGRGGGGRRRSL
jgi:small subunit ribosomal protein S6